MRETRYGFARGCNHTIAFALLVGYTCGIAAFLVERGSEPINCMIAFGTFVGLTCFNVVQYYVVTALFDIADSIQSENPFGCHLPK